MAATTDQDGHVTATVRPRPQPPAGASTVKLYFIVGPLRTGSSLLSRCIDDHPDTICLCESEINRALFPPHYLKLHFDRMRDHGLTPAEIVTLLDRKPQRSVQAFMQWHVDVLRLVRDRMGKPGCAVLGDKSPDYFTAPALVEAIAPRFPLIYTVRDPRAIIRSIWRQTEPSEAQKRERWNFFLENIRCWEPHLDRPNLLVSRYEDLVTQPMESMARIYRHIGLAPSTRFMELFERLFPKRFLWTTAIDWEKGIAKAFDPMRAIVTDTDLTAEQRAMIYDEPAVCQFMQRFGYS